MGFSASHHHGLAAVLVSRALNAATPTEFIDTRGRAPSTDACEPITHILIN
jgi:hypothetical protein